MKNKGVYTMYSVAKEQYGSYILGRNMDEILQKLERRGLNETIVSVIQRIQSPIEKYSKLNERSFIKRLPEIIHASCFMSWIALNAKRITPNQILGDKGILHELIHLSEQKIKSNIRYYRILLSNLEKMAIGLF